MFAFLVVTSTSSSKEMDLRFARAALSRYYVLKYVGETALSGLPRFSAASLFKTRQRML